MTTTERLTWPERKPKCPPGKCVCQHVAIGNGPAGFNVYKCAKCGDEEWL